MKKTIITTAVLGLLALAPAAFAQSTVTGTLSSGGTTATTSSSSLSGSVGSGNSLSGTVGSGNSLTGTVTSTTTSSSSGGGGGGGGGTVGSNGPPAGGGGGGGSGLAVVCPNLPNNLYSLPAGYVLVDGVCDPSGAVTTTSPGVPNTGGTAPGIPNTGAGGEADANGIALLLSGIIGVGASIGLLRIRAAR